MERDEEVAVVALMALVVSRKYSREAWVADTRLNQGLGKIPSLVIEGGCEKVGRSKHVGIFIQGKSELLSIRPRVSQLHLAENRVKAASSPASIVSKPRCLASWASLRIAQDFELSVSPRQALPVRLRQVQFKCNGTSLDIQVDLMKDAFG